MTMKTGRRGIALVPVLILMLLATAAVATLLGYASQSSALTRRALDRQRARVAAEAGLDYGVDQLLRAMRTYQFTLSRQELQDYVDGLPPPPAIDGYVYTAPDGITPSFRIDIGSEPMTGPIPYGNNIGLEGEYQHITICCGARNPATGVGAVVRQQLQALSLFMIRFGVFYAEDLEILPGPTMVFDGPVHSNTDLYLGGPLQFNSRITAAGDIIHKRKNQDLVEGNAHIANDDGTLLPMIMNGVIMDSRHDEWMTESLLRWDGNIRSAAHGVSTLDPPINPLDVPHDMIERPLSLIDPAYSQQTENEKFANKAAIRIRVNAAGQVSVTDFHGADVTDRFSQAHLVTNGTYNGAYLFAKDAEGQYQVSGSGCLETGRTFYDAREGTVMATVDIYLDQLLAAYPELYSGMTYGASQGRGILYVTRDDPDGIGGSQPAVRLRNGRELPSGGLSVASDLPIYVEGNYNVDNAVKPALVMGDAVTLLSYVWQDARSGSSLNYRVPRSTAFNTVIMTGNTVSATPEEGGAYNGGLENVLRFLEKWTGYEVWFRGSIIDIWQSEIADSAWSYGIYYTAPNRNWGYDQMYRTAAPPGMPRVFGIEEIAWAPSTWAAEGWE